MGISLRIALAALPVLALAQNSSYQYYTFTVNSQVTTITLPAIATPATTVTEVTSSAVATITSTLPSDTAAPASTTTPQEGVAIPITIQGYITTIVLPYWAGASHPSAPLTTSTLPAAVAVLSEALNSAQSMSSALSNAAALVNSVFSAASATGTSLHAWFRNAF